MSLGVVDQSLMSLRDNIKASPIIEKKVRKGDNFFKREIPAHRRNYLKTVLFGNKEPITENVFNQEEYGGVTKGIKETILQSLRNQVGDYPATFFDTQGRLRDRRGQDYFSSQHKGTGSYEPFFNYYMHQLPIELRNIIGSARYNLKKGDYFTENLTIDSDQYNFNEGYTGTKTEPGLNIANLREYYNILSSGDLFQAAERFGMEQLPDEETVARWKADYGIDRESEYVPVDITIPVSDIFTKAEWDELQTLPNQIATSPTDSKHKKELGSLQDEIVVTPSNTTKEWGDEIVVTSSNPTNPSLAGVREEL